MEKTTNIDSSGLGAFFICFRIFMQKKIRYALCHLNATILIITQVSRLDQLTPIYETKQDALSSFQSLTDEQVDVLYLQRQDLLFA